MSYGAYPVHDDDSDAYYYFLLIVTGYNCSTYVERCLNSIKEQSWKYFYVEIVDDGSTDDTFSKIEKFMGENPGLNWHCQKLEKNTGTFHARHAAVLCGEDFDHIFPDHKYFAIAMVDMDDCLLPEALRTAVRHYLRNDDVWMTYGNYQLENGVKNIVPIHYSDEVHANRDYRKDQFRCTHLRTFRRELYEMIPAWGLTKSEINSYPYAELLFSMMEMCGKDRIGVIEEPIYLYNTNNPISTLKRFGKDNPGYEEICNRGKRELITQL